MGEERLPHLHSQVVRRVDEDIKIISNKIQQNKQIFSLPYSLFLFYVTVNNLAALQPQILRALEAFNCGTNDIGSSLLLLM